MVSLEIGPEFVDGLYDPDPGLRAATARALGFSHDPALLSTLMVHLDDPDQLAGDQVAEAIGRLGDASAVPLLLAALSDTDETLRARAATALGLLHAEEAIPQLSTMRRLDGPLARRSAAEALAAIGTPAATVALNALNPPPILAPIAALPAAPAPPAALPGALVDVPADYWTRAALVALLALMLLAAALIGKGPRRPKTHFGPA